VPVERLAVDQLEPRLVPLLVEQAELDALGVLREEREVRAVAVPLGAERERFAWPDLHQPRISTVFAPKSATRSVVPRRRCSRLAASSASTTSSSRGSSRWRASRSR